MSKLTNMSSLPPEVDTALDRLLADWTGSVWDGLQLAEPAIGQDVIIHAEDLGYAWWSELIAHMPFHSAKAV
ncbi:hypothetical protein GXP70_16315 [Paenibacillus lycopersici]|uniref:Uncharacterized protein n=1 Tax=Paenibacillus lycopersici TaxID=2704462 RepID=A0A6C0FW63_9BACL|nr:hypothetical protein [Paenibacillus lycopersici]QHT61366.1 hypothetical protein GXP70_16315 [Paenibacillus lycopersici]